MAKNIHRSTPDQLSNLIKTLRAGGIEHVNIMGSRAIVLDDGSQNLPALFLTQITRTEYDNQWRKARER